VLQCVLQFVCYHVLQCVFRSVTAVFFVECVLQSVAVGCSVMQCVAMCCDVFRSVVAVCFAVCVL